MVCGFGDSVGYETLISRAGPRSVDKSSRFTDWSRRPLTERQLVYALSDVTHLRPAYEKLKRKLARTGREHWLEEEIAVLTDPALPGRAGGGVEAAEGRTDKPRFLAILKEIVGLARTRGPARNMPRNRVLRDEALLGDRVHAPSWTIWPARGAGTKRRGGALGNGDAGCHRAWRREAWHGGPTGEPEERSFRRGA